MGPSKDEPVAQADVYLLCLAAGRLGLLAPDRLAACLQFLRSLPPGSESVEALIDAGLIQTGEADEARRRMAAGWLLAADSMGSPPSGAPPPAGGPGERPPAPLGRLGEEFELLEVLGRGALSTVYRAREVRLGRVVALKVLHAEATGNASHLARFEQEAQAAARVDHPSIVKVFAVGEAAGQHFISMEFIAGMSLREVLRRGPIAPRRALEIARDVARALAAANAGGVIHRDVKPGNILIEPGPGGAEAGGRARLVDFGLARLEAAGRVTRTGEVLGTLAYISPEQALGRDVDARTDVYSLGATLYHALSGRPPYGEAATPAAIRKLAREDPEPIEKLVPGLGRDAAAICNQALRWEPAKRYAGAKAMSEDIDRFLRGEAIRARSPSALEKGWRWIRNHRYGVAAALLAAGCLIAWVSFLIVQRLEELRDRERDGIRRLEAAHTHLVLKNPIAALEEIQGLPEGLNDRQTEARALALDALSALDLQEEVRRLLPERSPAALKGLGGEPFDLVRRLVETHRLQPAMTYLLAEASGGRNLVRSSRASLELAKLQAAAGGERGWEEARRRFALIANGEDLPAAERAEARDHLAVLESLGPGKEAAVLGAVEAHTLGDLDGDGRKEPITAAEGLVRVWNLAPDRCDLQATLALPRGTALPGQSVQVAKLAAGDLDRAAVGDKPGAEELLVFTHSGYFERQDPQQRFELRAYRYVKGTLEPRGEPHIFTSGLHPGANLLVRDVTGDGEPEVIVGMSSEERGAKALVIARPFQSSREVKDLPLPPGASESATDTTAVFAGDLDGDGSIEVGCGTTAWRGYDLRLYRYDPALAPPFRFLSFRRVGSVGAAVAWDVDGDGAQEVLAATHSYLARNVEVFRAPPHKGDLAEGVHVLRFHASPEPARLEPVFSDPLEPAGLGPGDEYLCWALSPGGFAGKPACLASWLLLRPEGTRLTFLDLHLAAGGHLLRRHRVFWSDQHDRVHGYLADLNGDGLEEVVALLGQGEGPGSRWTLRVWKGMERGGKDTDPDELREALEAPPIVATVDWFLERREDRSALGVARDAYAQGNHHRAVALRWARAAGRLRDWSEVERALDALRGARWRSRRAESEVRMWQRAAEHGRRLHQAAPLATERALAVEFFSPSEPPAPPKSGVQLVTIRSRKVTLPAGAAVLLRVEALVERLDFDRHMFLGIVQEKDGGLARPSSLAAAIYLHHAGGSGHQLRRVSPWWNGHHPEIGDRNVFQENQVVRAELEYSPPERRARLRTESGGEESFLAVPAEGSAGSQLSPGGDPLPAGHYLFGVFAEVKEARKGGEPEALLQVRALDLYATP